MGRSVELAITAAAAAVEAGVVLAMWGAEEVKAEAVPSPPASVASKGFAAAPTADAATAAPSTLVATAAAAVSASATALPTRPQHCDNDDDDDAASH